MTTYTWEPIPDGETPEWGEWIKWAAWSDDEAERFVGVDPSANRWVTIHEGSVAVWPIATLGPWLRRVEKPHRWNRWLSFGMDDGWCSLVDGRRASLAPSDRTLVHVYCDADGELHVEQVDD